MLLREQDSNLRSYVIVTECLPHSPFVLCYIKHNIFSLVSLKSGWVGSKGFEPMTFRLWVCCSNQLSYKPLYIYSTPYWIWTNDFKFRKLALYPAELREHILFSMIIVSLFQHCKDMENISLFQIFCSIFFNNFIYDKIHSLCIWAIWQVCHRTEWGHLRQSP